MQHHILAMALVAWVPWGLLASSSYASVHEDFESDLSQWVGYGGGVHHAVIVQDPLRPGNKVVAFSDLVGGGDIFSPEVSVPSGQQVTLSFEYLGLPATGSVPDDFGGFIGYAGSISPTTDPSVNPNPATWDQVWIGGTRSYYPGLTLHLLDDAQWRSYQVTFTPLFSPIRVMLEDFIVSDPFAGDAYFDNISVTIVPEPATLMLLGLSGLAMMRSRRRMG